MYTYLRYTTCCAYRWKTLNTVHRHTNARVRILRFTIRVIRYGGKKKINNKIVCVCRLIYYYNNNNDNRLFIGR